MQQPITHRDVSEPSLSAVLGSREVDVESASIDRMLPDPVMQDSLTAASGEIVAVEGSEVTESVATPWDPGSQWPPVPESSASLAMDVGDGLVQLLDNGRVTGSSGESADRAVNVEIADQYQSLDQTISWGPVGATMPAHASAGWDWDRMRYVGMLSTAVTDKILRHCGWFATPPRLLGSALSIPGMGTMWPEWGDVLDAGHITTGAFPYWQNAPWGVGVADFVGEYELAGSLTVKDKTRVEMTALTTAPTDYSRMEITTEAGAGLARLTWTSSQVKVEVRGTAGTFVDGVVLPRVDGLVYATIRYVSDTSVHCIVRSGGQSASATVPVSNWVTTSPMKRVVVTSTGASAGLQVAFPWQEGTLEGWDPNARIYPRGANRNHLDVLPGVEGESCADLLAQQCEAEAATYWIDETGVLQWWDMSRLEGRSSVAELTADDDIEESGFTWSHETSSVHSRATVKWREPLREWHPEYAVTLFQGSGKTVNPGDGTIEEWVNTPDDEVWIMPDLSFSRLGLEGFEDFNRGHGSASGAVVAGGGDEADKWADQVQGTITTSMERVTDQAFKMSTSWTGNVPVVMRTPGEDSISVLWRVRRNIDLPIFRGKAKYTFTDLVTTGTQRGPASAPEHVVEAGWWIQTADQAVYTAGYYGARVTVPQPILSSVDLIPVPGLQIGDMVEVRDEKVTRLTIRGLVVEDSKTIDSESGVDHSAAIRPISVTRNNVTWVEWASVVRGETWADWATDQNSTWQQWGSAPLGKG